MPEMTDQTLPPDPVPVPDVATAVSPEKKPVEIGGPKGAEPTRYGDWTVKGRCIDF